METLDIFVQRLYKLMMNKHFYQTIKEIFRGKSVYFQRAVGQLPASLIFVFHYKTLSSYRNSKNTMRFFRKLEPQARVFQVFWFLYSLEVDRRDKEQKNWEHFKGLGLKWRHLNPVCTSVQTSTFTVPLSNSGSHVKTSHYRYCASTPIHSIKHCSHGNR